MTKTNMGKNGGTSLWVLNDFLFRYWWMIFFVNLPLEEGKNAA
jgi:hypothetical protein